MVGSEDCELQKVLNCIKDINKTKHKVNSQLLENENLEKLVPILCKKLKKLTSKFIRDNLSLETQIWWRDHQIADAKRVQKEAKNAVHAACRKTALAKLTKEDKKILGI